jgi:hypothetical protein
MGQVYIDSVVGGAAPWLSEGFAVYSAVRFGGKNTTYCYTVDVYAGKLGKASKGEDTAYNLICRESAQDKSDTPIVELNAKKLNQLDDKDLAKGYSLSKLFLEKEPEAGMAFLRLYDAKSIARCLKATFRMTPAEFDAHWRDLQK